MNTSSAMIKEVMFEKKSVDDAPFKEKQDHVCCNCKWLRDMKISNNPNRFYQCFFRYHRRMYYNTSRYCSCNHFNGTVADHFKSRLAFKLERILIKIHCVYVWLDKPFCYVLRYLRKAQQ
jgi:hypothetical protein